MTNQGRTLHISHRRDRLLSACGVYLNEHWDIEDRTELATSSDLFRVAPLGDRESGDARKCGSCIALDGLDRSPESDAKVLGAMHGPKETPETAPDTNGSKGNMDWPVKICATEHGYEAILNLGSDDRPIGQAETVLELGRRFGTKTLENSRRQTESLDREIDAAVTEIKIGLG